MKKNEKKTDLIVQTVNAELITDNHSKTVREAAIQFGEISSMLKIGNVFTGQGFIALHRFVESESYKEMGYRDVVEFFDDIGGISKSTYYNKRAELEREGEEVFALLDTLRIPRNVRALLNPADVTVRGDVIEVDGEQVALDDKKSVKLLLDRMAEKTKRQERELERAEGEVEKARKKATDAESRAAAAPRLTDPLGDSLNALIGSIQTLTPQIRDTVGISETERQRFATHYELFCNAVARFQQAWHPDADFEAEVE
jgi:hypothetical protein